MYFHQRLAGLPHGGACLLVAASYQAVVLIPLLSVRVANLALWVGLSHHVALGTYPCYAR